MVIHTDIHMDLMDTHNTHTHIHILLNKDLAMFINMSSSILV